MRWMTMVGFIGRFGRINRIEPSNPPRLTRKSCRKGGSAVAPFVAPLLPLLAAPPWCCFLRRLADGAAAVEAEVGAGGAAAGAAAAAGSTITSGRSIDRSGGRAVCYGGVDRSELN